MAFSKTLTCLVVVSYFEVLKKNADRFVLVKKSEARKSLNKSKYIFHSPVFEEESRSNFTK